MEDKQLFKQVEISEQDKIIFKELSTFLSAFNDFQKKTIISSNSKICCIAGAGTGKTTVLTKRIEFLINYKERDPKKILAITFTRKARQEMLTRLSRSNIQTNIETFNSFCEKILQKYQPKIYGKSVKVIDYANKQLAFALTLQALNIKRGELIELYFTDHSKKNKSLEELTSLLINDCFFIIDYSKSLNQDILQFSSQIPEALAQKVNLILKISNYLQNYLKVHGFRTYNDQLGDVINFFKKNQECIPEFEHLLVDEYQDINKAQIELLNLLHPQNIFVVGDPRQSIFGWRGSESNEILSFEKKYPGCETILLHKNYRSNKKIVDFMNMSIKELNLPDLESIFPPKETLFLYNFPSEIDEMKFIREKIKNSKETIFVLARTNKHLFELSTLLRQENIPHTIKKEDDFSEVRGITLSTIHAIKGLEAEVVFVMGCNEQNFPCKYSEHPLSDVFKIEEYDKEKEEKRLFYVALSRAKHSLYLTYSGKQSTYFISNNMKLLLNIVQNSRSNIPYINNRLFNQEEYLNVLEKNYEKSFDEKYLSEEIEEKPQYKENWDDTIAD